MRCDQDDPNPPQQRDDHANGLISATVESRKNVTHYGPTVTDFVIEE
jgi:hypothetical protein